VQYLPSIRDPELRNLLLHDDTVPARDAPAPGGAIQINLEPPIFDYQFSNRPGTKFILFSYRYQLVRIQ
jgi:hypothetical protein